MKSRYYLSPKPWFLPWELTCKGLHFMCYNLDFSRYVNNCLPSRFPDKYVFDNRHLILSIARYLWQEEHPE